MAPADGKASSAQIALLMSAVVVFGTLNNFTGRIRAETLKAYDGTVATIVDSMVYFLFSACVLLASEGSAARERLGDLGRTAGAKTLVLAGLCDQLGNFTGFTAQPHVSTLMYSLMNQAIVPYIVLFSWGMLGVRYSPLEIGAVCVVATTAATAILASGSLGEGSPGMAALAAITTGFPALSFVLKERVFANAPALRVPAVQFFIATVSLVLAPPVALVLEGLQGKNPFEVVAAGFRCLFTCPNARGAYVCYSLCNLAFNFFLLVLTGRGSALLAFLSLKLAVPVTALFSALPWPIIGPKSVPVFQWGVLVVMVAGVGAFRAGNIAREAAEARELEAEKYPMAEYRDSGVSLFSPADAAAAETTPINNRYQ